MKEEYSKQSCFPPASEIFKAFNLCLFENTKVVILGQDPYHGIGQANGLCFSVNDNIPLPPSLQNIFKELETDLAIQYPKHGNLESWAKQGVLLLNATLTVRSHHPGSHQNKGWEKFTDAVIEKLSSSKTGLVFMLWGNYAQKKANFVDSSRHLILKAAHPSPLSAHNGFLGCRHFSQCNAFLESKGLPPIDWALPEL